MLVATVLLTVLLAVGRRLWRPQSRPIGVEAEKSAAAEWISPRATAASRRSGTSAP